MKYYEQVLQASPANPKVLYLMGVLAHQEGQPEKAAELLQMATRYDANNAHCFFDLGLVLEDLGCLEEAFLAYRRAVNLKPEYFEAANNVGNILYKLNRKDDALTWFQKALTINPDFAVGYLNIGNIAHDRGQLTDAIVSYQRALALNPAMAVCHHHLGLVYNDQRRYREAIACYQQALAHAPDDATIIYSLGNALRGMGEPEQAVSCYREAIKFQPAFPEAYTNLGSALAELGKLDEALICLKKALDLNPDLAETHNNLGNVWRDKGDLKQALGYYLHAVRLKADLAQAHFNIGSVRKELGDVENAIQSFQRAFSLKPDYSTALNQHFFQALEGCLWKELKNLTFRLDNLTARELKHGLKPGETPFVSVARQTDPSINFSIAKSWSQYIQKTASGLNKSYTFTGTASSHPKIRIGYLSNDFRNHPIAHLILSLFGCHNRKKFEILCYSCGPNDGSVYRQRIQAECDRFIDLIDRTDGDAADHIYKDQVDILVDLMGYTRGHRLIISAFRPAPVQVSFLGFPGTTGADFFDYIIADRTVIPEAHKLFYSEKIIYMPHCYQVNDHTQMIDPTLSSAAIHGLPQNGPVFCAFHQSFKIDPIMFRTWMNILRKVPESVLWLLKSNEYAEQNLKNAAEEMGIDSQRLVFAPRLPKAQHLGRHNLADLMLDTRIYNGHTTTSDALWAGLPVISLLGSHFASRVSASILKALGMSELVTHSLEEYEKLAVQLAFDSIERNRLRRKISKNRLTHPLFDTPRYVRNLEKAYSQLWHIHSTGQHPRHIEITEN